MKFRTAILIAVIFSALLASGAGAQETLPLGASRSKLDAPVETKIETGEKGTLSGMILPLAGVLVLIAGCAYVFRIAAAKSGGLMGELGAGGRAPSGVLSVLGRYPVSRGQTLVLLKVDRRVLLLCQNSSRGSGSNMSTLCEFTDAEDVASLLMKTRDDREASQAETFSKALKESDRRTAQALNVAVEPQQLNSIRGRVQRMTGGAR
jgi:flagellar biogenesis protein FliO